MQERVPINTILRQLAEQHGFIKKDGSVHKSALADFMGVYPANVTRALERAPGAWTSSDFISKMIDAFGITPAEAYGDVPLGSLSKAEQTRRLLSSEELKLLEKYKKLARPNQRQVQHYVDVLLTAQSK